MKVVLFCGGQGTRLKEYSQSIPKPLVPVGGRPILWNLMRYYAHHGHKEFILCLGYRGDLIKDFFLHDNDFVANDFRIHNGMPELLGMDTSDWTITLVDTGFASNIGQRLLRVRGYLEDDEIFLANYSDALSDVDINVMVKELEVTDKVGSFVSVKPSNSLSQVTKDEHGNVLSIDYLSNSILINGGFFVFRKSVFDYINEGEELVEEPFERMIEAGGLMTHEHKGFWCAMDTFKDKKKFYDMFESGNKPWEVWSPAQ